MGWSDLPPACVGLSAFKDTLFELTVANVDQCLAKGSK